MNTLPRCARNRRSTAYYIKVLVAMIIAAIQCRAIKTGNDPNGYYLLVNSESNKGLLYEFNVKNLCPNTYF